MTEARALRSPDQQLCWHGERKKDKRPMKIRPTKHDDIAALQEVLDGTELFPSEMLPDMVGGFLADGESADIWLTCEANGKGYGGAIVEHLEAELKARGQRILIADTSGVDGFAQTRAFYRKSGYSEEARIRDFWAAGDDKIVFWKSLS
jgi:GNAT superfamily N-acetyltransferase